MIILIAAFLRLYQLPTLPPGLNFDEAGSGAAALEILSGSPKLWWRLGGGQEPFWPYLAALSTAVLGHIPLALRLPAALIGILSVAAVYPLMLTFRLGQHRRDSHVIAVLTTLGLAVSGWHLHFSRLGFRAILLPLFSTLAFYFLWRGLTNCLKSDSNWNANLGLPGKASLALQLFRQPLQGAVHVKGAAGSGFWFRGRRNSLVGPVVLASFFVALAIYSYLAARLLLLVPLLFFGLQWLLIRLKHFSSRKDNASTTISKNTLFLISYFLFFLLLFLAPLILYFIFNPADLTSLPSAHLFLLCWWVIMLLPAILAPEGAPHHLRLIGTIVPTYALVAIGFVTTTSFFIKILSRRRHTIRNTPYAIRLSYLLPATCYLFVASQTYTHYFVRWPVSVDFTLPFDLYAVRLAADIDQASPQVGYVLPMDIRAGVEARHYTIDYLLDWPQPRPYTYIPVDERDAARLLTQAASGKNELRVVRWTDDKHREADAKEIVTYLLETSARLQGRDSFPVYDIETYILPNPQTVFTLPAITQPVGAIFTSPDTGQGLLHLEIAFVPGSASIGVWLPVALTLAPLASMDVDYKASLRLISPTGERVAQKDRILLHNFHQGTSLWPPEPVNEYYLLLVPSDTPPGDYTVAVVIYHPETQAPLLVNGLVEAPLGQVSIE
ncbi:MAG: hypothetical protein HYR94_15965 [Chloroflexi bacterium]|nr:hypothetical protein [Chloroflexota bacterium]